MTPPLIRLRLIWMWYSVQPHGFFNCSPAVDVPPSDPAVDDARLKERVKGVGQADAIQPTLLSKL